MSNILQRDGLTLDILRRLSYKSQLGINLKKNLHYFDKEQLIDELKRIYMWYVEFDELHELALDYRIKSIHSAILKYERYYPDHQAYYQQDGHHYPVEIQYNTYYDRQFNNWLHKYVYKKNYNDNIGLQLRKMYESAKIQTEIDFKEALKHVLSDC